MAKRTGRRSKKAAKGGPRKRGRLWSLRDVPGGGPCEPWPLAWKERAYQLVAHFNQLRVDAKRSRRAPAKGMLQLFWALDVECASRGVVAEQWIEVVLQRALTTGERMPGAKEFFRFDGEWTENKLAEVRAMSAFREVPHFIPGRDLHAGAEVAKNNYLVRGHAILCLDAFDITYGYHSQSTACAMCPLKDRCAAETAARLGAT